jgi:hypothetical protein
MVKVPVLPTLLRRLLSSDALVVGPVAWVDGRCVRASMTLSLRARAALRSSSLTSFSSNAVHVSGMIVITITEQLTYPIAYMSHMGFSLLHRRAHIRGIESICPSEATLVCQ